MLQIPPCTSRKWLAPDHGCIREDGLPFPPEEHPDRLALATGQPVSIPEPSTLILIALGMIVVAASRRRSS